MLRLSAEALIDGPYHKVGTAYHGAGCRRDCGRTSRRGWPTVRERSTGCVSLHLAVRLSGLYRSGVDTIARPSAPRVRALGSTHARASPESRPDPDWRSLARARPPRPGCSRRNHNAPSCGRAWSRLRRLRGLPAPHRAPDPGRDLSPAAQWFLRASSRRFSYARLLVTRSLAPDQAVAIVSSSSTLAGRLYEGGEFAKWALCAISGVVIVFWGKFRRVRRAPAQGQLCAGGCWRFTRWVECGVQGARAGFRWRATLISLSPHRGVRIRCHGRLLR
jgi:hypothetical protein